ncbi:auxin-responsive protein SAUR19-like [Rutidosis leptorrhynchoides]|uniref:auxin-responsive protein SAUR19-like n=1 Tax=Rutidosis leptorrhynchoides TaxID=125765 RepID=UPI003A995FD8
MHNTTTTSLEFFNNNLTSTAKLFLLSVHQPFKLKKMAIRMPRIIQAKKIFRRSFSNGSNATISIDIPKGYFGVYVGEEEKTRFVVPLSLLSQPMFQELLHRTEEEFGYCWNYNHPMGGLTIECSEHIFTDLASRLGAL